jgi:hypothetical protein
MGKSTAIILASAIWLVLLPATLAAQEPSLRGSLHILTPVASETGDASNLDRTLTQFLEVTVCVPSAGGGCSVVEVFSYPDCRPQAQGCITLEGHFYHVNWKATVAQVEFQFSVAGLAIGSLDYQAHVHSMIPIKFMVDNNPRIRVRVLHQQGYTATQISQVLVQEFGLGAQDSAFLLMLDKFSAVEVGFALRDVFNLAAWQAAQVLKNVGYGPIDVGLTMRDVYGLNSSEAAKAMRLGGFNATEVAMALQAPSVYGRDAGGAAGDLRYAGFNSIETAQALKTVYGLNDYGVASALKQGGFQLGEIVDALKAVFPEDGVLRLEDILNGVGFGAHEVQIALLPDLVVLLGDWVQQYGPTIYFHHDEQYQMASIDWYLQRACLRTDQTDACWGCGCGDASDFQNLTPANLIDRANQRSNPFIALNCSDDVNCSLHNGDPGSAKAYVVALRNRKTRDTALQFWLFYPYNGPATMEVSFGSVSDTAGTDPMGRHTPDWELVTVWIHETDGTAFKLDTSAHGGGIEVGYQNKSVVYASLNGHANFPSCPTPYNNPMQNFSYPVPVLNYLGIDTNLDVNLINYCSIDGLKSIDTSAINHFEIVTVNLAVTVPEVAPVETPKTDPCDKVQNAPFDVLTDFNPACYDASGSVNNCAWINFSGPWGQKHDFYVDSDWVWDRWPNAIAAADAYVCAEGCALACIPALLGYEICYGICFPACGVALGVIALEKVADYINSSLQQGSPPGPRPHGEWCGDYTSYNP